MIRTPELLQFAPNAIEPRVSLRTLTNVASGGSCRRTYGTATAGPTNLDVLHWSLETPADRGLSMRPFVGKCPDLNHSTPGIVQFGALGIPKEIGLC